MADASFTTDSGAVTFRLLLDGAELSQTAAVTVRHIPGGNANDIDLGGLESPVLKCRAVLTSFADLLALQALQGAEGTLDYAEATLTAVLRSATRNRATGRDDVHFANLEFVQIA